jgi:hypothetical protein
LLPGKQSQVMEYARVCSALPQEDVIACTAF